MQQPKLSVLMPVWNAERYLAGAIESILTQTLADFELLIVDDGSTDASKRIARGYRDHRIRLIENDKNLGITKSLNVGLAEVRGTYTARMDADDLSAPQRLARQAELLDANPQVALVTCRTSKIDARGVRKDVILTPLDPAVLRARLRIGNCIAHGSVMLRTAVVRALGGYDECMERAQDYDLWLRLSEHHELATLPENLYAWREHARSAGERGREEQDRFAARARHAARRRFAAGLIEEVVRQRVTAERAARRILEVLREEAALLPPPGRAGRLSARCWRRIPRTHARWFARHNLESLEALRQELAACDRGWQGPEQTCNAVVSRMEALADRFRPSDQSRTTA